MQQYGYEPIVESLKALVYAVLRREEALWSSCPKMNPSDYRAATKDVAKTQLAVDAELKNFRLKTENRFAIYTDAEVILSAFLISSIWHSARDFVMNSQRLGDLIGRHRPKELAAIVLSLTEGKSPVLAFTNLKWDARELPAGQFRFRIRDPKLLQKLVFGQACLME